MSPLNLVSRIFATPLTQILKGKFTPPTNSPAAAEDVEALVLKAILEEAFSHAEPDLSTKACETRKAMAGVFMGMAKLLRG